MIFRASFRNRKFGCGVSILIGATLAILMFKRGLERYKDSIPYNNNLTFVTMAVHAYGEAHGHLPSVITDGEGRPMHSWRVLLLPYLGQE